MDKIAEMKKELAALAAQEVVEKYNRLHMRVEELEARSSRPTEAFEHKVSGPGSEITEKDLEDLKRNGRLKLELKNGLFPGLVSNELERKTTITSAAVGSSTPGVLIPTRRPGIVAGARRRLTMMDVLPVLTATSNVVDFVKEDVFTSASSPQLEASDKAEASLTFTVDSESIRTIAHWIPMSKQVTDDLPGLQDFVSSTMIYGLMLDIEDEILNGSGAGVHMSGICVEATAYAGTFDQGTDQNLDRLAHAILELEAADEIPSVIVLNPKDYHDILLIKDEAGGANLGRYVALDPIGRGQLMVPTIWNRSVVVTNSIASGQFLVGDANQAAIWQRQAATVEFSAEHSDFFIKNLLACRAEWRGCVTTYRPGAWRYGAF